MLAPVTRYSYINFKIMGNKGNRKKQVGDKNIRGKMILMGFAIKREGRGSNV